MTAWTLVFRPPEAASTDPIPEVSYALSHQVRLKRALIDRPQASAQRPSWRAALRSARLAHAVLRARVACRELAATPHGWIGAQPCVCLISQYDSNGGNAFRRIR